MGKRFINVGILLLGLLVAVGVQAAGDATRGAAAAEVCALCHGDQGQGNAALGVPRIGGQEDWYVARQLTNFQAGLRGSDPSDTYGGTMRSVTAALGDDLNEQLAQDIGAYIASLSPGDNDTGGDLSGDALVQAIKDKIGKDIPAAAASDLASTVAGLAPGSAVSGDATKGKAAYLTCVACHGAKGEGSPALNSPRLAGQHDWYLVRQLQNYKSGIRANSPQNVFDTQMKPFALMLATDEAVNDMAAYINSL